jgi:type IV secretion system protein VirB6
MMKIRALVLTLLLSVSFNQIANAYGDPASLDDTCTQGTGILNRIVLDLTTLGLFSAYSAEFHMDGADDYGDTVNGCNKDYYPSPSKSSGGVSSDGVIHAKQDCSLDDSYDDCDKPACDPKGGVYMCYEQWVIDENCLTGCTREICDWAQDGFGPKWYWAPPGTIRVAKVGDKLCVQFDTTLGYQSIGCKYLPQCKVFELEEDCFVASSCSNQSAQESRSLLPITGVIIQCISESVTSLFYENDNCEGSSDTSYSVTSFPGFQDTMRNAVRSCLMLYVILFGLKTVLGSEAPSKKDMFLFGARFLLVMYFSIGINININSNEEAEYSDGITKYMLPLFINGSSELANMVYSSGGSEGLCAYTDEPYPDGYSYLSLWDSIDCRILYYFGIDQSTFTNETTINLSNLMPTLLGILLPAIFSFQLIFLVFSIMFFLFFLSIIIYFVNVTVISIILITILVYLAPVFVPMVLFEPTKKYYEGWLKLSISYALQPMIIAAYIAMMMTIYDQTMFGDCVFKKEYASVALGGHTRDEIPIFKICDPNDSSNASVDCTGYTTAVDVCNDNDPNCTTDDNITLCADSVGYLLNPDGVAFTNDINAIFFTITILNSNVASDMLNGLITLCLFGYLFYKFADMLGDIAAELSGGPAIGSAAGNPMALVKAAAGKAMAAAKSAAGGGGGKSGANSSSEGKQRSGAESNSSGGDKSSGAESKSSDEDKSSGAESTSKK